MAREHCEWKLVTDLRPGSLTRYYPEWVCWMVEDGDSTERPPTGGGGGSSGIDIDRPPSPIGFTPDPSGSGDVTVGGFDDSVDPPGEDFNPGWNSGAYSIESLPASWVGTITFDVPDVLGARPAGVAVGLTPVSQLPTAFRNGYDHILYGLVFTQDEVKVLHDGEVVDTMAYATVNAARTATGTDEVAALMYGHFIKWVVNGLTLWAGPFSMPEAYALDAVLYLAYDRVDNPVFTAGAWAAEADGELLGVLPGFTGYMEGLNVNELGGELGGLFGILADYAYSDMVGALNGPQGSMGVGEGASGIIGPLFGVLADSSTYSAMIGTIGPITGVLAGGDPGDVPYSVMHGSLPRFTGYMTGPGTAKLGGELPGFIGRMTAETTYAELVGNLPGLRGVAYGDGVTPLVKVIEYVAAVAPALPAAYIAISFIERVDGSATAAAYATVTADASEEITAEDAASAVMTMLDSVLEQLGAGERLVTAMFRIDGDAPADEGPTWVVNTDSRATTRYDAYGFNSFFALDGKHFGVRQDGVYLLEGTSDAGQPIVAGVALGKHDFGTQALKGLEAVYAGVSSAGKLYLRVSDGKNTYTYAARAASETLEAQRFDVGRGLRANYFTFELVSEGDAFELDNITFNVLASQRRI